MILRVKVEKVEKVKVYLGPVVSSIRLSAELNVALLVAIEDISGGAECRENLAELIVLVGLVEASSNLVHRRHGASWSHVNPESRKEAKDSGLKVLRVHHDVHFVFGVARIYGVSKATIVIVPFHHEGATRIVLSVLKRRPSLGGPSVRVEVAFGRAIERRILRVFTAMMILDVLETLTEVLVVIGLTPVSLIDHVRE